MSNDITPIKRVIKYEIDQEVLDTEPFDPKFIITHENKSQLIKYFEKIIRNSFEYRWLIDMFKNVLNVKSCVFFKGYSLENGMKLEFHHHPFTLYDYTEAVVNKQLEDNGENWVLENEVAKEVSMIHYRLMVGLVPLDPTAHQQVHDKVLDIQPELIIGDYEVFFREYNNYIPEQTKSNYLEYLNTYSKDQELVFPENFNYKPSLINASNKHLITTDKIDKLLLEDKLDKVNNLDIKKLLETEGETK